MPWKLEHVLFHMRLADPQIKFSEFVQIRLKYKSTCLIRVNWTEITIVLFSKNGVSWLVEIMSKWCYMNYMARWMLLESINGFNWHIYDKYNLYVCSIRKWEWTSGACLLVYANPYNVSIWNFPALTYKSTHDCDTWIGYDVKLVELCNEDYIL